MSLMSKKKQPFIIDENLSTGIKPYLPGRLKDDRRMRTEIRYRG